MPPSPSPVAHRSPDWHTAVRVTVLRHRSSVPGAVTFLTAKSADSLTTFVALTYVPGVVERNAVAAAAFEQFGVVGGIILLTAVTTLLVVAGTEVGATRLRRRQVSPAWVTLTYAVGYGVPSVLFASVAVWNVSLIVVRTVAFGLL